MYSINTNLASMAALESLNATQQSLTQTQNQVSTGQKVASASDNPAIYAISQTMNANIAGLAAVQDNLSFGQSVISTAQAAAKQISSELATLQKTITQGDQNGMDVTTMNNQIQAAITNINAYAGAAKFNGLNLLDNSGGMTIVDDVSGSTLTVANMDASANTATGLGLTGLKVSTGDLKLSLSQAAVNTGFDTKTLTIKDNGAGTAASPTTTYTFEFVKGTDAPATVPAATFDASGNVLTQTKVIAVKIDPTSMSTNQMTGALVTALQQNSFGVQQNQDGSLEISGNNMSTAAGFSTTITGGTLAVDAVTGTSNALQTLSGAITRMDAISAALGAAANQVTGMQNFSSSLSDALTAGVGALTDADMAAESAKLQSLQTKQQLAIQSLSIANQQPQVLLTLFR